MGASGAFQVIVSAGCSDPAEDNTGVCVGQASFEMKFTVWKPLIQLSVEQIYLPFKMSKNLSLSDIGVNTNLSDTFATRLSIFAF